MVLTTLLDIETPLLWLSQTQTVIIRSVDTIFGSQIKPLFDINTIIRWLRLTLGSQD